MHFPFKQFQMQSYCTKLLSVENVSIIQKKKKIIFQRVKQRINSEV